MVAEARQNDRVLARSRRGILVMSGSDAIQVFVSYSHQDTAHKDELLAFLKRLEAEGVEFWSDERITTGDLWDAEIRQRIMRSHIALVLVSQAFLDSKYCTDVEISGFLDENLLIFPVILSACEWKRHDWLKSRQFLPRDSQTIEEHFTNPGSRKALFLEIRKHLRLQAERQGSSVEPPTKRQLGYLTCGVLALRRIITSRVRGFSRLSPVPSWQARLAEYVNDDMKIFGVVSQPPEIKLNGRVQLTEEEGLEAEKKRGILQEKGEHNDPYAMLEREPNLRMATPHQLAVQVLDWAELQTLRAHNKHRPIVSAGAVLVCKERRLLVLHPRTKKSVTYPSHLHIVAGGYRPPGVQLGADDGTSLVATAQREVHEETKASVALEDQSPILLSLEKATNFFQLMFLGATITPIQVDRLKPNWEVDENLRLMSFDDLPSSLADQNVKWVPTGRAIILAWLAHGAPGAGWRPRFDDAPPQKVFDRFVPPR